MPVTDDHDNTSKIVELARIKFPSEAILIKQRLEDIGIRASVIEPDNLGRNLSFQGHRIMVFARDFDRASQVVAEVVAQDLSESDGPSPTVTKHIRHRGDA